MFFQKTRRIVLPIAALCILTLIYMNGKKVKSRFLDSDFTNSSYLSDIGYFGPAGTLGLWVLLRGDFNSLEAFEALYRDYEFKSQYGLLDANNERVYHDQFAKLSADSLLGYQQAQLNSATRGLHKAANLSGLKTPAIVLAAIAAAYTGRAVEYRVAPDLKLRSQSLYRDSKVQHQYLGLSGKVLSGSMDYWGRGTNGHETADYHPALGGESTELGTRAEAGYLVKSKALTVGVSQKITDNIKASYDRIEPKSSSTEHKVGIGFTSGF